MAERIAVYVDGANAYFAQKEALQWWIDWPSFLGVFREGKDLVTARWYQAYRGTPEPEQDRFLHHLTIIGFAVKKKVLKQIYDRESGNTSMKGNLDIELAIDALTESSHYDTALLVTGDSDFVPLVEALRARGKRVMVAATQQNVAVELRQAVGVNYIDLRDLRPRIESDKRPPERTHTVERLSTPDRTFPAEREEAAGNERVTNEFVSNYPADNEPLDQEPMDNQPIGNESIGNQPIGNESIGNRSIGSESIGSESIGSESIGNESIGNELIGNRDWSMGNRAPVNGNEYSAYELTSALDPMPPSTPNPDLDLPQEGEIVRCNIQAVKNYGVFLDLHEAAKTLLHVKDMNRGFVSDAAEFYRVGEEISVQVVSIDWVKAPPEVRVQVVTPEMEY